MADLSLYIVTFNCGREYINVDAFASQLFRGLAHAKLPDLLVLSLQEIAPVAPSLIGGSFLVPYFNKFHDAVKSAARKLSDAPEAYTVVVTRNVGMIGLMVFAKDAAAVQDLEIGGVGLGASTLGNKAAVGARFRYGSGASSAELTLIAAHLAAGEAALQQRNEDWKSIVRGLVFSSASQEGTNATSLSAPSEERPLLSISPQAASIYKPTSHLFLAGDLNYRTSIIGPSSTDHLNLFPQPHHDKSSPQHYSSLFENDQLNQEIAAGNTCHGLIEAPVTFPPTYKYDSKEPFLADDEDLARWHWATHRWPSWCDRILWLDIPSWMKEQHPKAKITAHKYSALPLFPTSDHRAVTLDVSVPLIPIPEPSEAIADNKDPRIQPPYDIDIDWKSKLERGRRLELLVGYAAYFTTTPEGATTLFALLAGTVGAYFALRAILL